MRYYYTRENALMEKILTGNIISFLIINVFIKEQTKLEQQLLQQISKHSTNQNNSKSNNKTKTMNKKDSQSSFWNLGFFRKKSSKMDENLKNEQKKVEVSQWQKINDKREKSLLKKNWLMKDQQASVESTVQTQASASSRKNSLNQDIQCSNCKQLISIRQIEQHEFNCIYQIECQFCGVSLPTILIEQHFKICEIKKLWQQQQQQSKRVYESDVTVAYGYDEPPNNVYGIDEDNPFQIQQQLEELWDFEEQQPNNKKQKGLANCKINNLYFTSYKRPKKISTKQIFQKNKRQLKDQQDEEPCPICYMNFEEHQTIIKLPCLHGYHPECVGKWFEDDDRCPFCKIKVQ